MPRGWRKLILALPLLVALPLAADPQPPAGSPPAPAARKDVNEQARLRQEARTFLALPPDQRERMTQRDADLHPPGEPARQRLLAVLRRYAAWLDRLPEPERRLIAQAPTRLVRLRRVRELREEQWLRRQPRAVRDLLTALQTAAAAELTLPTAPARAGLSLAGLLVAPGPAGRRASARRRSGGGPNGTSPYATGTTSASGRCPRA